MQCTHHFLPSADCDPAREVGTLGLSAHVSVREELEASDINLVVMIIEVRVRFGVRTSVRWKVQSSGIDKGIVRRFAVYPNIRPYEQV